MKTFQAQNINSEIKLTESITEDGSKYKCVFIKAGKTKTANKSVPINGVPSTIYKNYKSEAIKIAISEGVFEGAPVLYRSVDKHLDADEARKRADKISNEGREWFKRLEDGDPIARRKWQKIVDWSLKEFQEMYELLNIYSLTII